MESIDNMLLLFNFTCTVESIAFKSSHTCAVEAAIRISAVSIGVAWIYLQFTLLDICRLRSIQFMRNFNNFSQPMKDNLLVQMTPSPV